MAPGGCSPQPNLGNETGVYFTGNGYYGEGPRITRPILFEINNQELETLREENKRLTDQLKAAQAEVFRLRNQQQRRR